LYVSELLPTRYTEDIRVTAAMFFVRRDWRFTVSGNKIYGRNYERTKEFINNRIHRTEESDNILSQG
jgi:hypothetical protein